MTEPNDSATTGEAPVLDGTDVTADPAALESDDLDAADRPATTDPEQLTDEGRLGGAGGQGGAG